MPSPELIHDWPLYASHHYANPICHTIEDIIKTCNEKIMEIITSKGFDKPVKYRDENGSFHDKSVVKWSKTETLPANYVYVPIIFSKDKIELKALPSTDRFEGSGLLKNAISAILGYTVKMSAAAFHQLGLNMIGADYYDLRDNIYCLYSRAKTYHINISSKSDVHNLFLYNYVTVNKELYWTSVSDKIDITNIDTLPNLITGINTVLTRMQNKLNDIKNETAKCKFVYNEVNKIVTYIQPDKYKCQLHVSPRVLRLLGIVTENEWITATILHSIHKPSIDKFLQTMWIYSNIIQPVCGWHISTLAMYNSSVTW